MTRRFVEHTAELELELESDSQEGVFAEALLAFAELVSPGDGEANETRVQQPVASEALAEHHVSLESRDLPSLLAAWLEELVFLSETEGFLPESTDVTVDGLRLTGVVRGRRGEPRPIVKAVTLHRLRLRRRDGVWQGRVVLDV